MSKFCVFSLTFLFLIHWGCEKDFSPLEKNSKALVRKEMVLFASDRNGGNMNIWMMEKDGSNPRQITHYPTGDYWPGDISPDGKYLLFNRFDARTLTAAIYLMPIEGPEPAEEDALIYALAQAGNFFPDGQKFIYFRFVWTSDTTGHDALFIFDLKDSSSVQISPPNIANWHPQVSPDGNKVAYVQFYFDQFGKSGSQLYLMNLDGTNKQALTPGAQGIYAKKGRFSPDGSKLFFTMYDSQMGYDPYFADTNTGQIILILNNTTSSDNPCPDTSGTKIYFRSGGGAEPDQTSEIAVVNIDGSELKKLTNNQFREDMPVAGVIEFYE